MLYRPYIYGLYAAINVPIHRFAFTNEHKTSNSKNAVKLMESWLPNDMPKSITQSVHGFASNYELYTGDFREMRSPYDFGAVKLPDNSLVIIGPLQLTKNQQTITIASLSSELNDCSIPEEDSDVYVNGRLPRNTEIFGMKIRVANLWLKMIGQIVLHESLTPEDEQQLYGEADTLIPGNLKGITKEIKLNAPHNQYRYELAILDAISEGNVEKVTRAFSVPKQGKFGILAPDPLRSMQNHVHNLNSLASRAAIKAGILPEKAYAVSDKFFMAAEECKTEEQCVELRIIVAQAFASMVNEYKSKHLTTLPPLINNAVLLISRALYNKCTVAELAQRLNVSADHLERSFKKHMGLKVSSYILQEKLKQAQELLRDTNESIADIAHILAFQSAAHFSRCFKDYAGISPSQYRANHTSLAQG